MMGVTGATWAVAACVDWCCGEVVVGLAGGWVSFTDPWEDVGEEEDCSVVVLVAWLEEVLYREA